MRFTKSDAAVTLLTLLLAGTLLWFFFQEFNRTVSRGTMEPAGTIVFKRRAADRRAVVGLIWERMRNNSPVYDGDILRTGGGAEAAILFDGGGGIDLFENTMLELNLTAEGRNIAVETGSFVLSGSDDPSARPLVVSLGNHGITLPHGASAAVTLGAGRLEIDVTRGSLSVSGPSGETVPVEQGQGVVIDLADGERTLVTYDIVPENPAHNAKLLLFGTGPEPVLFGCSGDSRGAVLEIAAESGFGQPLSEAPVSDSGEAAAALPPGVYFWRFRNDDSLSPPRRIVVLGDSYPAQIGPAPDAAFSFRRTPPQVQFSWTSSEYAVSYRLEIAADDGFSEPVRQVRTLLSSARATMPGEGTWFWRVVPEYPFETAGGTPAPEIRELRVARSETMESPAAVSPLEGTLVSIDTVEGKGLSFSWNPVPEAVGYELRVYPPGSGEAVRYVAGVPFLRIGSDDAAPYQAPGNYSWEVSWRDGEGILSPPGERRTLHVIDSEPSFYLTFPPDGYTIADSLAPDTRFAWKSEIPARTVIEVADDPEFIRIVYQETVQAETILGKAWSPGEYRWRVTAYNADGSVFRRTEDRGFRIIEPYPGPVLTEPDPGRVFVLREGDERRVLWPEIEGADYYRLSFTRNGAPGGFVYESPPLPETEIPFPFGNYPEGDYTARIQAFSVDRPDSTRIIGYIGESPVRFRILSYAELLAPSEGERFDGLSARRLGIPFVWKTTNEPEEWELVVMDPEGNEVIRIDRPGQTALIPRVEPGEYSWRVGARLEGFDISSRESRSFTVDPVPPLPAPQLTEPEPETVIGPEILRSRRWIRFSWDPVPEATHYRLSLYRNGEVEPAFTVLLTEPGFLFEELPLLDRGDFRWTVTALALEASGSVDIPGTETEGWFSIDLPAIGTPAVPAGGDVYGR